MATSTFVLRPMLPRDCDAQYRVMNDAFWDSLMPVFHPNGHVPEDKVHDREAQLKRLRDTNSVGRYMVVIDTTAQPPEEDVAALSTAERNEAEAEGRMAGFGFWKFYPSDRTDAELDEEAERAKSETLPPSANVPAMEVFFGALGRDRRKILGGKAYYLLNILAVDPHYHRRGVGAMHLKWGLDQADEAGIPAFLEASPYGQPLYARWGFEPMYRTSIPEDKMHLFKGQEEHVPMIMYRPAKAEMNGAS